MGENLLMNHIVIQNKITLQKDFRVNGTILNSLFKVGVETLAIHLVFIWPRLILNHGSNNRVVLLSQLIRNIILIQMNGIRKKLEYPLLSKKIQNHPMKIYHILMKYLMK